MAKEVVRHSDHANVMGCTLFFCFWNTTLQGKRLVREDSSLWRCWCLDGVEGRKGWGSVMVAAWSLRTREVWTRWRRWMCGSQMKDVLWFREHVLGNGRYQGVANQVSPKDLWLSFEWTHRAQVNISDNGDFRLILVLLWWKTKGD